MSLVLDSIVVAIDGAAIVVGITASGAFMARYGVRYT